MFCGCATLPNAARDMATTPAAAVEVENARGPLTDRQAENVVDDRGVTEALEKHLAYEQSVSADNPLVLGNRTTLLLDGPETYAAMFADMRAARDHINLETYIFSDDAAGEQFASVLLERQRAGVQVNIIYDSFGSMATAPAFFDPLRAAGIRVLEFNPLNPLAADSKAWRLTHRDHRKLMIIDGRIAFTGGINISDDYSSRPFGRHSRDDDDEDEDEGEGEGGDDAQDMGWRDTHLRIEGPVVEEFQKLFLATWKQQGADPLPARNWFPKLANAGDALVRALPSAPDSESPMFLTLMSAITRAQSKVHLTIAYFAPDQQLREALIAAARRGVDVELILPGRTDSWLAFHHGRSHYAELLRAGIRIHERRGGVMHAKTACIDAVWCTIGSTNLDWRSFLHNDEINAVVIGREFAAQMETVFAGDIAASREITARQWRRRSPMLRLKEAVARLASRWL